MLYLQTFSLPGEGQEWSFLEKGPENRSTCYGSRCPFGVFQSMGLVGLEFEPITILCGGNGSGKTTLLNLIGEKLALQQGAVFNCSSFYRDYLDLCRAETTHAFARQVQRRKRFSVLYPPYQGTWSLPAGRAGKQSVRPAAAGRR